MGLAAMEDFPTAFDLGADGLAYDCSTDTLFGIDANTDQVFSVDPATGLASGFVATTAPFHYVGLEFEHSTGMLLASTGWDLYRIDPVLGTTVLVGELGGERINDLAFHPPCP